MMKIFLSSAAVLGTVALVSMATAGGTDGAGGSAMSGCGTGGCGMGTPTAATTQPTTQASSYVCPMHKEVISDKAGKCPKCGMKLVAADKSDTEIAPVAH